MLEKLIDEWSARTGKTKTDAASILGVHYGTLCSWVRGEMRPRARQMHGLSELLGCDPVTLLHSFSPMDDGETRTGRADNAASATGIDSAVALADTTEISGRTP